MQQELSGLKQSTLERNQPRQNTRAGRMKVAGQQGRKFTEVKKSTSLKEKTMSTTTELHS